MARIRIPIAFALAAALGCGAPLAPAGATSIAAAPPHDPRQGCAAILHLVANLNAGRAHDPDELLGPNFYADAFGKVEEDEEAAFLHAMRNNAGHADAVPIRLYHAYRVHADVHQPVYLVVLERRIWRETRLEEDGMMEVYEVRDPRHYLQASYWLASFSSNEIRDFREAGELYSLMDEANELADCASP